MYLELTYLKRLIPNRLKFIDSTSKFHVKSSLILHPLWEANPRRKNDIDLKWITRRRSDFQNRQNIDNILTKYPRAVFDVVSISNRRNFKLVVWCNTYSCFHFVLWLISPLAIYSKLNLKSKIWKMFLSRCNCNVK